MRTLPLIGALALFALPVQPASAQMCGAPGQQAQASTATQGGGMCGSMGAAAEDDPMADKPAAQPKQSGMCPCCGRMAMMRGGMGGMMGGGTQQQPQVQPQRPAMPDMPGMGQPKQ